MRHRVLIFRPGLSTPFRKRTISVFVKIFLRYRNGKRFSLHPYRKLLLSPSLVPSLPLSLSSRTRDTIVGGVKKWVNKIRSDNRILSETLYIYIYIADVSPAGVTPGKYGGEISRFPPRVARDHHSLLPPAVAGVSSSLRENCPRVIEEELSSDGGEQKQGTINYPSKFSGRG